MSIMANNTLTKMHLYYILIFFLLLVLLPQNSMAIQIKGQISVRAIEEDEWNEAYESIKVNLVGVITGELDEAINADKTFCFSNINPIDNIIITWEQPANTQSKYVLYPFIKTGKSEILTQGIVSFKFRKLGWVFKEFKRRIPIYANRGNIDGIQEIFKDAGAYYDISAKRDYEINPTIENNPSRYLHSLLQLICQTSDDQRQNRNPSFFSKESVKKQQEWYFTLIRIASEESYTETYPRALENALNAWVRFSSQCYTKHKRWPDRKLNIDDDSIDRSFKYAESKDWLFEDISEIQNILDKEYISDSIKTKLNIPNDQEDYHPFRNVDSINMHDVVTWIYKLNKSK